MSPSLTQALDALSGTDVVVVPLLLSAGYHVLSDIPSVAAGRLRVRVTPHLGPDPLVIEAVASRLAQARGGLDPATSVLAAIGSTRDAARAEVALAAHQLSTLLGRAVDVLSLGGAAEAALARYPQPIEVAVYLLAEGGFLAGLRRSVRHVGVVADPIGVHPALVSLVWQRYDALNEPPGYRRRR